MSLTAFGHGIAVIGGQCVHCRAGSVDQNGWNGAAIHGGAIDSEQQGQADNRLKGKGSGQQNGDGDRGTHTRDGPDDDTADRADQQRDQHFPLSENGKAGKQLFHDDPHR